MAGQRRMKRQNFVTKNKLQMTALLILFISVLVKMVFLEKKAPDRGMEIYLTTFTFIFMIALILANTLREVVRKAIVYRNSRNQYKNAVKMMRTGAITGFVLGMIFWVLMLVVSTKLTNAFFLLQAYGKFPMILAAAGIPFLLLAAALIGTFEGLEIDMSGGAAGMIFAISDLLCSIAFILLACRIGEKHSMLLHDSCVVDAFAAAGAAAGFAVACFLTALWVMALSMAFGKKMKGKMNEDNSRNQENFSEQLIGLLAAAGQPFIRYVALYGAVIINQVLRYLFYQAPVGETGSPGFSLGAYACDYVLPFIWFILPFGMTLILSSYVSEYLEKIMKKEDLYHCGMRMIAGIKQYLCMIFPMICVLGVCLKGLNGAFFSSAVSVLPIIVVVAVTGYAILEASMLTGMGKEWLAILCSLAALIVQSIAAVVIFSRNAVSVGNSILYCNIIYAVVFAVGCGIFLARLCVYKKHWLENLVLPFAAAFAAVITAVLCMFLQSVLGGVAAAILAIVLAAVVHMLVLIVTGCVRENELSEFPQGNILAFLGHLLGIYS